MLLNVELRLGLNDEEQHDKLEHISLSTRQLVLFLLLYPLPLMRFGQVKIDGSQCFASYSSEYNTSPPARTLEVDVVLEARIK